MHWLTRTHIRCRSRSFVKIRVCAGNGSTGVNVIEFQAGNMTAPHEISIVSDLAHAEQNKKRGDGCQWRPHDPSIAFPLLCTAQLTDHGCILDAERIDSPLHIKRRKHTERECRFSTVGCHSKGAVLTRVRCS